MKVFILSTGNVDATSETTVGVYETADDAKEAAMSAIHQIFEDEPWLAEEEDYYYEDTIQENGDWVVSIMDVDCEETAWWRVKEEDLK